MLRAWPSGSSRTSPRWLVRSGTGGGAPLSSTLERTMVDAVTVSAASVLISLASLCVALRVAWETKFKPAKLVAKFPSVYVWRFPSDEEQLDPIVLPRIVFANVGARTVFIEDIRLELSPPNRDALWSYVDMAAPGKAIEQPGEFLGERSEIDDYARLFLGNSFSGIVLASGEVRPLYFRFSVPAERREEVVGMVDTAVQVRLLNGRRWKTVAREQYQFAESPFKIRQVENTAFVFIPAQSQHKRKVCIANRR